MGWLADRSSNRQTPLLLGMTMLVLATLMLGLATNIYVLVTSRVLQGLSSAIIYTCGLALLLDTVGQAEIGQWMGIVLSFANVGLMLSPVLGGIVYANGGYNAILLVMLSIVVLDILLRLVIIEKRTASKWTTLTGSASLHEQDQTSSATFDDAEPLLASSHSERRDYFTGHNHQESISNSKLPTMVILLRYPRVLVALYGVFLAQVFLTSFDGVLPRFVKQTFSWDPMAAGLIFLTISIPAFAAPLAGALSDRYGPRWIVTCAFILATPLLACLSLVTQDSPQQVVLLCVILTLFGKINLVSWCPLLHCCSRG